MTSQGKVEKRGRTPAKRGRLVASVLLSLGLHLAVMLTLLPWLLASRPRHGLSRGAPEFVFVTGQEPAKARRSTAAQEQQARPTAKARPAVAQASRVRVRSRSMETRPEPAEQATGADEEDSAPEPAIQPAPGSGGSPNGRSGATVSLNPGYGVLSGSLEPAPECLDGLDNDGDRLIDSEDPGCLPPPRDDQEEAEQRTKAALLSDMRRDDPMRGDPDELMERRMVRELTPRADGGWSYRDGSFHAEIGPDGEVRFSSGGRFDAKRLAFDIGASPRSRRNARQKLRFLDATADLREDLAKRARARQTKRALLGLRDSLERLWADRRLTVAQKKRILFERLDECDRETAAGRSAARTIVQFIREHSRRRADGASRSDVGASTAEPAATGRPSLPAAALASPR